MRTGCLIRNFDVRKLVVIELIVVFASLWEAGSAPEWKEFIKIAVFVRMVSRNRIENQLVEIFGMFFGPCIQKTMKEEPEGRVNTRSARPADVKYVYAILKEMEASAKVRGTGIAKRTPQSLCQKIYEGKAVIAMGEDGQWAGFSYIEAWGGGEFVSNSGLIVNPVYRNAGVATAIKQQVFELARRLYPTAKIFSITTGAAILKMNSRLGFEPVVYADITQEQRFWDGCKGCELSHIAGPGQEALPLYGYAL